MGVSTTGIKFEYNAILVYGKSLTKLGKRLLKAFDKWRGAPAGSASAKKLEAEVNRAMRGLSPRQQAWARRYTMSVMQSVTAKETPNG